MEFKVTKGKWEIKHSQSKDAFNIVGTDIGGHYKIARIPYLVTETLIKVNEREKSEAEANAKLIACAPEMLEMLQEIYKWIETNQPGMNRESISSLIKKAIE